MAASSSQATVIATVGQSKIEVVKGDLTSTKVDAIVCPSTANVLKTRIFDSAGVGMANEYDKKLTKDPSTGFIATSSGQLPCKSIYFIRWEPDRDPDILKTLIIDLISVSMDNADTKGYTSIAFPAIGCSQLPRSIHLLISTMFKALRNELRRSSVCWTVKIVVLPDQEDIYNVCCEQISIVQQDWIPLVDQHLPKYWDQPKGDQIQFLVSTSSEEYHNLCAHFNTTMKKKYRIIKIERIQNETWYRHYVVQRDNFKKRLKENPERYLYHGCPREAADNIVQTYFNRGFAGCNGTAYGVGVYFSTRAVYSHDFAKPDHQGERCMFVARVLIGKTTTGDSQMKMPPPGYDSTTDGDHIFVVYHDGQAYGEYLITYK